MIIIVGLGNPGETFSMTRHNAGFMALDFFAQKFEFPEFKLSKKDHSLISKKDSIMLIKPQTFMNESGLAVKRVVIHYKIPTPKLIVVHDDIDLPLGNLKLSKDSGAGGHKGVDSIISHLGTKDFIRLKIGIGNDGEKITAKKVVLKKFTKTQQQILKAILEKSANALDCLAQNGLEKAMNEYNR